MTLTLLTYGLYRPLKLSTLIFCSFKWSTVTTYLLLFTAVFYRATPGPIREVTRDGHCPSVIYELQDLAGGGQTLNLHPSRLTFFQEVIPEL
jgi:hypothetical protein